LAHAGLAQLVERLLAKQKVASSSLVSRSKTQLFQHFKVKIMTTIKKQERRGDTHFLEFEAPVATLNEAMDKSFQKLVKNAKIPGFRKGKVSRSMYEKYYGEDAIVRDAVMDVVNSLYAQSVEQLDLQVIDYPKNLNVSEYKPNEPLTFSLEVAVVPEVKLGTYKGLSVLKEAAVIDEIDVQKKIDETRERYAEFKIVENEAKEKDILSAKVTATIDNVVYEKWTRDNMGFELGKATLGKDFDTNLTGKKAGERLSFDISFPTNSANPEVAGNTVHFEVELLEVRAQVLPEMTEEWVQKVSQFKTPDDFVADIRTTLQSQKEKELEDQFYNAILDEIFKTSTVEVPEILTERQIDQFIQELENNLKQSGLPLERYLQFTQKTAKDVRNDYRAQAERKVKTELVLDAVVAAESLSVSNEDLITEVKGWRKDDEALDEEKITGMLGQMNTEGLKKMIVRRKAINFIVDQLKK